MKASRAPRTCCPCCPEKRFSWRLVGILLVAPVLLLSLNCDACGEPPKYDSMTLKSILKNYYAVGEKIFYKCNPGYYITFPVSTYCEKNHSWFPIPEGCSKKECNYPRLKNGEFIFPNFTSGFNDQVHFHCDEGYHLEGEAILTCNLQGDEVYWSDEFPQCEKIYCQPPAKIKNGKHTNSHRTIFEYNELITFSCNRLKGSDQYSLVGERELTCIEKNKWSSRPPQCKVVKCDYPVIEHGRLISGIKEKYYYQAMVLLECLPGFYLNGSNRVFCGENSTWDPKIPKCIKGFKPTHPTKPPVSRYPGYPEANEYLSVEDFEELDVGILAVIVLTILVGIVVLCTCLYRCLKREKKGLD
ncbi:membrane cofactor protein-like isoform X2 [Canis lupus familiaris]|uniref:membrane cofactor protein-like isoform X2 n=1 Tax=Canis lupus familiaris TaxID=9615 RepID=UPI000BAA227F|nr:membrane cofactor protein-like isoform X2 [Canis lupus familiaris]XP_022276567.1 membrane cofactor protein-like isoform X2 [Canis lupus familiaris]XP_038397955.1 membrane cofactor protein-like isoform X2 [Canis lupus familiaris]XP_038397956.1 membrane cofactor protein-like isoform X2 [Canis lupus familiaris]XP_038526800.1 membrane cofactor protein-like isoform X2 [Canis lupus familiaris]XP_038526801.1 membrane cofactor protein-like isoform X2 [Canis lupus familiaris]XP_048968016.1 membrane|eukprot:XP_022276566.1 membrane cofactor protein-like isoform X2 [Canis lupus familiaris]